MSYSTNINALTNSLSKLTPCSSGQSTSLACLNLSDGSLTDPCSYLANSSSSSSACQLCEKSPPNPADVLCEQCDVFYCQECRKNFHPSRGPLAQHSLIPALKLVAPQRRNYYVVGNLLTAKENKCSEHRQETLNMFCTVCKLAVCCLCLQEAEGRRHDAHDVQSLPNTAKMHKTEKSYCEGLVNAILTA
uniref:B box-type domain-containing protein n=1 Tax=Romanomermis culicivorax TaxID=13658 RepID=A0A915IXI2_ROMCU